ncbi:MAG TPA: YceI family protein [Thermoanaerobaculia bacterium]
MRIAPCVGLWACAFSTLLAQEPTPAAAAARYSIDAAHSTIAWELPATLHTVHGQVPDFSGSVELESGSKGERAARGRVTIRAGTMRTGNESRDKSMREKVLEVDPFPEIVFDLDRVETDWSRLSGDRPFEARVAGRLTVHGKTLPLEVPVTVEPSSEAVTVAGSFPVRWKSDYGLYDPSFAFVTVGEPMKVTFRLRAVASESTEK